MNTFVYNPRHKHGGGYRVITIQGADGPVQIKSLDEKLLAAKIIYAHIILGASRQEAEEVAAEEIQTGRKSRRWFFKRS